MFVEKNEILKTEMADGVVRRMLGYGDKIMACEMIFLKAHMWNHIVTATISKWCMF